MADWPEDLTVGSIREWPGELTADRRLSPFRGPKGKPTKLTTTLADMRRELEALRATDAVLLVAIPVAKFRRDGKPYANAIAEHPGVILSFEKPGVGALSYPADAFTTWEDNLRAIVLSLESLRRVDRYGVTRHGEQYRGFLAIEARATGAFTSNEAAFRFLAEAAGMVLDPSLDAAAAFDREDRLHVKRRALFQNHPDRGGDGELFQKCLAAVKHLQESGLL